MLCSFSVLYKNNKIYNLTPKTTTTTIIYQKKKEANRIIRKIAYMQDCVIVKDE